MRWYWQGVGATVGGIKGFASAVGELFGIKILLEIVPLQAPIIPKTKSLFIRLFGSYQVQVGGIELLPKHSRKEQWLLALLALRHGSAVERDWLADTLWPDSLQNRVMLRDTLYDLRQALGSEALRLTSPTKQTLRLDLAAADVDVLEFDAAIARGDRQSLADAVGLYRGALLEGCTEEWVFSERCSREQSYLSALEALAAGAMKSGDTNAAVGYLRRVISVDNLREKSYCQLMQALADQGSYAELVQVYRGLRSLLASELRVAPSAETASLFERLRDRAPVVAQSHDSGPSRRPEPKPCASSNLFPPLTSFIGREQEIEDIRLLLKGARLLTVTGSGGCGKTRLCRQVGVDMLDAYQDGVWFVELAALSDPELVAKSLALTLGLKDEADRPIVETVVGYLQGRCCLLILDNCEHLIQACAVLADNVLNHCPFVRVLASSRQALGISGEQLYRVPSLSLPSVTPLMLAPDKGQVGSVALQDMIESEAVRLFIDRARAVQPEFTLTPTNAGALSQICVRLDGIPLAIELAAARVLSLSVDEINMRLDDRFRLLNGGSRTALPRQQTLKALIDWDYDLLTCHERMLFARLSVFSGGWSLEAAEAVCCGQYARGNRQREFKRSSTAAAATPKSRGAAADCLRPTDVMELLASMVDKNLVQHIAKPGSKGRYLLLESIREYARYRLEEAGESNSAKRAHREYFIAMALEASPKIFTAEQSQWLDTLELEHENCRSALAYCAEDKNGAEAGVKLAGALAGYWTIRGHWTEGRHHLKRALERECTEPTRARALYSAGTLAWYQSDYETAQKCHEESLALYRRLGDKSGIADAMCNLSVVVQVLGDTVAAKGLLEQSLVLVRDLGRTRNIANTLGNLACLNVDVGDYSTARIQADESLSLFRQLGNTRGVAFALVCLGDVSQGEGDLVGARRLYTEGCELRRDIGDSWGVAGGLTSLADIAIRLGEYAEAKSLHTRSLGLRKESGDRSGMAVSLFGLGCVAAKLGDTAAARVNYASALRLHGELAIKKGLAGILEAVADMLLAESNMERAAQSSRLLGAAQRLRDWNGERISRCDQDQYDRIVSAASTLLGESTYSCETRAGYEMTVEQAIEFALGEVDRAQ